MDSLHYFKILAAFFAVMNPFVNLPLFLTMTAGFTPEEQRTLAFKITLYAIIMCMVVLFAGSQIIAFFGVSVAVFKIAGGLLLAKIAWSMVNGQQATSQQGTVEEQSHLAQIENIAFYPMTFPFVAGPGTIATIIIYTGQAHGPGDMAVIAAVLMVVLVAGFAVMASSSWIGRAFSETMRVIMKRLMGMILLAIAIEMMAGGLTVVFPVLGGGRIAG